MSRGGAMPGGQEDPRSSVRQDIYAARDAYVAGHDLTVHNYYAAERALYRIDNFDLGRPVVPVEQARERPSRLLQVRYELIDFVGREPQLDELTTWRDSVQNVVCAPRSWLSRTRQIPARSAIRAHVLCCRLESAICPPRE